MTTPVIVVGCGGHSKVLIDALQTNSVRVLGITDIRTESHGSFLLGVPVIGDDRQIFKYAPDTVCLVNGIGSTSSTSLRRLVFEKFKSAGYRFATVVHSNAVVSQHTQLDEGVQIMAGAVIQAGACIGINAIVNTRSSVDHDCIIGAHVHVAPGATLSGGVVIEDGVHIGTGSTVIQGICIGKESTVGAGAVVISHVNSNRKVVGIPAKELRDD